LKKTQAVGSDETRSIIVDGSGVVVSGVATATGLLFVEL
jgi:hypothetical protein